MRKTARFAALLPLPLLLGAVACTGRITASAGRAGGNGPPVGGAGGAGGAGGTAVQPRATCTPGASFAPARLTRLSDDQYRNIVRDTFGVTLAPSFIVTAPPSTSGGYPFNENAQVDTTTVQAYLRAAEQVAAQLSIAGCPSAGPDATCVEVYLRSSLPRAWRRPVTPDEIASLMTIFKSASADGSARQLQLTIEAALIHPAFLYRAEIGGDASVAKGKVSLTPHELATSLAFALLNSAPDGPLWSAAEDGSLTQPSVLAAQVTRLLALPAVRANLKKKVSYYLDFEALPYVQKDAATYPSYAALQPTLYDSSQRFLEDIVWSGHFRDLFTSRRIYANEAMAGEYGLPQVKGAALQPIEVTGGAYGAGLLTQPALLAASDRNAAGDDVVHRGLWIYYNLICAPVLPPPPANAGAVAAQITGSTREQADKRDSTCGTACHVRFDPFGLVTLGYDGIGRYRTTDPTTTPPGGPLDTTATVMGHVLEGHDDPVTLAGVDDLARLLAEGRQVSDCAVTNLATYTLDHDPNAQGSCDLDAVKDRFRDSGSFTDLFTALVTSPAFLTRDIESQP